MGCNCNDDNRYIIQLDNVGVDGFSPTIDFTDQTSESFKISVVDINGTSVSDAVPLYGYVSGTFTNINSSIGSINSNINTMSGDITTLQGQMANIPSTYLSKTEAASTYLTQTNAASTYLTQSNAASTYLSKTDAATTYLKTDGSNTGTIGIRNGILTVQGSQIVSYAYDSSSVKSFIQQLSDGQIRIGSATNNIKLEAPSGYSVLYNNTEIATVNDINNSTITLTQGGVTKGTFTVNSANDVTIDLDASGTATNAEKLVYEGTISGSLELAENNDGYLISKYTSGASSISIPVVYSYLAGTGLSLSTTQTHAGNFAVASNTFNVDTDVIVPRVTQYTPVGESYTIDTTIDNGSINIKDNFDNDEITLEANKITFTTGGYNEELSVSSGTLYYNTDQVAMLGDIPTIETGSTDGTISVDGTNVPVYGLGSMAYESTSNYNIEAHKAYEADGDLLTDSDGLAFVTKYAHSTFDSTKFTLQGTPTISSDGIASGINNSNFIKLPVFSTNGNDFVFTFSYTTPSTLPASGTFAMIGGNDSAARGAFQLYYNSANRANFACFVDNNGTSVKVSAAAEVTWAANTTYDIIYKKSGTTYKFGIKKSTDSNYTYGTDQTSEYPLLDTSAQQLGNSSSFVGLFDLKQISLTIAGVPTLSGNKTGVDTIKPDDYTVTGSPTISDDGVASGFSTSNYIATEAVTLGSGDWEMGIKFNTPADISGLTNGAAILSSLGTYGYALRFYGQKLYLNIQDGSNTNIFSTSPSFSISASTSYLIKTGYKSGEYYYKYSTDNGLTWTTAGTQTSASLIKNYNSAKEMYIGVYTISGQTPYTGSIDLNAVKITVNGDLVYQPCLKIPYTKSKTGSKVVDSVYRPRVSDMYEQYGYAPYYTLLQGTNFTLPQGELYGLIGQRTLRDTYRNGIFYYDLYSDRTLEQGGSCTSGTDVTFLKPFADTNYVLTVPYSAKTATGFTPSQTGDWIAKGIGA